jgi:RecJ-like exonuclease
MPTYKQSVNFRREFVIIARDAAEANDKLEEAVSQAEFDADLRCEGTERFEDEPVECPKCKGVGTIGEDYQTCDQCDGECSVPFSPNTEVSESARQPKA